MKRPSSFFLVLLGGLALAQFPISQPFTGTTAPGWALGGSATLTAATGVDPAGSGYLRLTGIKTGERGYAYYDTAFPSGLGLDVDFEYLAWGGTGADGMTLFLFDGSTRNFKIGDEGGALGYCQGYNSNLVGGLSNAYVGIGFDEYGNFASSADRCPNGGIGRTPDAVTIRGPGNGKKGYAYLTTSGTLPAGIDSPGGSARPASTSYYRRVIVSIVPAGSRYQITVRWQTSPDGAFQTLINGFTLPNPPPPTLKLGFAATTGGSTNYHEIRNVRVQLPADVGVSKTGPSSVAPGAPITYTVSVTNSGPNSADGSTLTDTVPASISGVTWTCTASAGAACGSASGSGNAINLPIPTLPAGGTVTLTVSGTVSPLAGGTTLTNTATVSLPTGRSDPNPNNNTSTVNTSVSGYTLRGSVYADLEPDGARNGSESGTGLTLFVKRATRSGSTCSGPALEAATVDPATGAYSFTGVVPGDYCLILDDNSNLSDTTPTLPASPGTWRYVSPPDGVLRLTQPSGNLVGQDFGLFNGGVVTGRVFYDDGEGGGIANNALQDGSERGVPNLSVTASQGSSTRTALTDASGNYTLWLPAGLFGAGSLTLSHPQNPATGSNVGGSSVSLAAGFNDPAARQRTLAYVPGQAYTGYNFGLVRESRLYPDGSAQATSPGSVTYSHLFRPGTLGSVTLNAQGGFTYLVRRDADCNGQYSPGEDFQGVPLSFTVDSSWPREADGSLKACALELLVVVPAGKGPGTLDPALLSSSLVWTGNPGVTDPRSLTDLTTVQAPGSLSLTKGVRNCGALPDPNGTCSSSLATSISGKPGEVLEYCITYLNPSTQAVTQVVIRDPIPFFSSYVTGSLRLNGTILSDGLDADAGEVSSGLVVVRVGNVNAGGKGEVCYRVQIR